MFASNLRTLRSRAGLKQRDVAAKIGRKQGVVSKWERDESSPQVPDLRALSELFAELFPDLHLTTRELVGEAPLVLPSGPRPPLRKRHKKPGAVEKKRGANAGA